MTAACEEVRYVVVTLRDGRRTAVPKIDAWFPAGPHRAAIAAAAKAICATCPEQADCLAGARDRREEHGIWGGADFGDEARDRRRARINHGTRNGYMQHRRWDVPPCEACTAANAAYSREAAARQRARQPATPDPAAPFAALVHLADQEAAA